MSADDSHLYEVCDFYVPRTGETVQRLKHSTQCPCGRGELLQLLPMSAAEGYVGPLVES